MIDRDAPLGRTGIAYFADGSLVVSWVAQRDDHGALMVRRLSPTGELDPAIQVARVDPKRSLGFPTLASDGERMLLAWTKAGATAGLRMVTLQLQTTDR